MSAADAIPSSSKESNAMNIDLINQIYKEFEEDSSLDENVRSKIGQTLGRFKHRELVKSQEGNGIRCVAMLNENEVVSGSSDGSVRIWGLNGKYSTVLSEHTDAVTCIISIGGNLFVSGSADNTLRVWNGGTKECISVLSGHHGAVWCVTQINNNLIVSGSSDKTIRIWNIDDGQCVKTFGGEYEVYCLIKITRGGEDFIFSGSRYDSWTAGGLVIVWNMDGKAVQMIGNDGWTAPKIEGGISDLIQIDKDRLLAVSGFGEIVQVDVNTGEFKWFSFWFKDHGLNISFIAQIDDHQLAICSKMYYKNSCSLEICDFGDPTKHPEIRPKLFHSDYLGGLALIDKNRLVCATGNTLLLWNRASNTDEWTNSLVLHL